MSLLALALVLLAALLHAGWNFTLKKSGGGSGLIALATLVSLVVYAPVAAVSAWVQDYRFEPFHVALMFGAGMVHMAYILLLDRAYRSGGDLSIVYPLARTTGPMLTILVAVFVLGEQPGPIALAGAGLVLVSALLLTGNPFTWHQGDSARAIGFALATGCMIAAYTLIDKRSVATLLIPPLVYDWGCNACRTIALIPYARKHAPGGMAAAWRDQRATVLVVAILSPLGYILVLTAMVFTPVSLVAPARELSILFAAIMGAHFLQEGDVKRRVLAAAGMVLGVIGLAVG
jgi:drug/metabolite transporter (DMT)-like permease